MSDDYYATLGVSKTASIDEIKTRYRQLALTLHPDRCEPSRKAEGEEKFKAVSEAYQVLSDPEKRKAYDRFGKAGMEQDNSGPPPPDISNILRGVFGAAGFPFNTSGGFPFNTGGGFPFRAQAAAQPTSEEPIRLVLPLEMFYLGPTISVNHKRKSNCPKCRGAGSQDGKNYDCSNCKGEGVIRQTRGNAMFKQVTETPCAFSWWEGSSGWVEGL